MLAVVLRRLMLGIPTLLIVSALTFSLLHLTPGDPARVVAGTDASEAQVERVRVLLGLDEPIIQQFLTWLGGSVQGDLGLSIYNRLPVADLIVERLPVTLSLVALAMTFAALLGIPLGLIAGLHKGSFIDRALTVIAVGGVAVPSFFLGLVLLTLLSGSNTGLPVGGYEPLANGFWPWLQHLLLPALTLAFPPMAEIARQMRSGVVDVAPKEYVRSAEAKGLSGVSVALKHISRNASLPVVTVLGIQASQLLGAAVIVEAVFNMPGLGSLLILSVFQRDLPVVQGIVLLTTVAVVVINLFVDVAYGWLDPRVRKA